MAYYWAQATFLAFLTTLDGRSLYSYTIHPDPPAAEPCALRMMDELTDRTQVEWQEPKSNDSMNERNALTRLTSSTFSQMISIFFPLTARQYFCPSFPFPLGFPSFLPFLNSPETPLSSFIELRDL